MPVFSYYKRRPLFLNFQVPREAVALTCGVFQVCTNEFCSACYKEGELPSRANKASPKVNLELKKKNGEVIVGKRNKSALWTFNVKNRRSSLMYSLKCSLKECNSNKSFCSSCSQKLSCVVEAQFDGADATPPFVSQIYFVQSSAPKKKRQREEANETNEPPKKKIKRRLGKDPRRF